MGKRCQIDGYVLINSFKVVFNELLLFSFLLIAATKAEGS